MGSIAHMPGPQFLALYAPLVLLSVAAAWWLVRSSGSGRRPPVPADPDPYELAYVQNGENGLSELALIELTQSGRLAPDSSAVSERRPKLKPAEGEFRASIPGPLQRIVTLFNGGREVRNVVRSKEYKQELEELAQPYRQRLDGSGLIASAGSKSKVKLIALAVLGLGAFKLFSAVTTGHFNIVFLILLMAFAGIALLAVGNLRLTWTGLRYMKALREAYGQQTLTTYDAEYADPTARRALLTVAALYGAAYLMQTPGAAYATMIGANNPSYHTGGGCGASCSSGGDGGGGGCGGGCGGCGGGD